MDSPTVSTPPPLHVKRPAKSLKIPLYKTMTMYPGAMALRPSVIPALLEKAPQDLC